MKRAFGIAIVVLGIAALAACGDKPQTAGAKKVDTRAFEGAQNPYAAVGWKAGDRASWEEQMRARAQVQNEYLRVK